MKFKGLMLSLGMLGSSFAVANHDIGNGQGQRFVLPFHDQIFRGQSQIPLKLKLKQLYPRLNLRNAKLQSVRLVAKSRFGHGRAQLITGHQTSFAKNVPGNNYDFHSRAPYTYARIDFFAGQRQTAGAWKIALQGLIKVKRVVVTLKKSGNYQIVLLDRFRVPTLGTREIIPVHQGKIKALILRAPQGGVLVKNVIAKFGNGNQRPIFKLKGLLRGGQKKVATFQLPRFIKTLIVTASAPRRGGFRPSILAVAAGKAGLGGGVWDDFNY